MKGKIPEEMLGPVIDSLPVELTLTNAEDQIIMWSQVKPEIFHRPDNVLGTDVRDCHSEKSQDVVNQVLEDMKSGKKESSAIIIDCTGPDGGPAKVRIEYLAVRDSEGKYLGCLELCNYVE